MAFVAPPIAVASIAQVLGGLVPDGSKVVVAPPSGGGAIGGFLFDRLQLYWRVLTNPSAHTVLSLSVEGTFSPDPNAVGAVWIGLGGALLSSPTNILTPTNDGYSIPAARALVGAAALFAARCNVYRIGLAGDAAAGGTAIIQAQLWKEGN